MRKQLTSRYVLDSRFWRYLILAIMLGISGAALRGYEGLALFSFCLLSLVAGLAKNLIRRQASTTPLLVKVVPATQLVHVKPYVVDQRVAFTGSANLTYSGMNRNIERIEMKTTSSEVRTEIGVFASLWGPQPAPAIYPTRTPPATALPQPRETSTLGGVMTREEAETLERLYGGFQPTTPTHSAKLPATQSMGVSKTAATLKDWLLKSS